MKNFLLFTLLSISYFSLNAQLPNGSTFTGNVTGTDVLTDERIDVQEWLADGKTVVLDVFATWCGPCWSFHATGWLDAINTLYGPEGTDQIRVLGVEADGSTPVSGIMENQFGEPGSWLVKPNTLEPITYSIIDSPAAAATLNVNFFPMMYIIRPNGSVVELTVRNLRYNAEYWIAALGVEPGPNAFISASLPSTTFCDIFEMDETRVDFENLGHNPISSASVEFYGNGQLLETVSYSGPEVDIFKFGSVQIPPQSFDQSTELTVILSEINGDVSARDTIASDVVKPLLETEEFVFQFTTDFYALEASWMILDDLGTVIASDSDFASGPFAGGGGGPDANITHEYELSTTGDINCLTVIISDSYGDGYRFWSPGNDPQPGWGIIDSDGNVVKESDEGYFSFTELEGFASVSNSTSSINELDALASFSIYPNPASADLNVEFEFTESTDFRLSILNMYGQIVKDMGNQSALSFGQTIDISNLSSGMYFISVISETGQKTFRFNKL